MLLNAKDMDQTRLYRQKDGQGDSYIPPPKFVCGGYKKYNEEQQERKTLIKHLQALDIISMSLSFIYNNISK